MPKKLPDAGIFLSFEGTLDFARVRLRTGTKFDLILAEVPPERANGLGDQYALTVADKEDWVKFVDPLVVKTEKMEDECLFQWTYSPNTPVPFWQITVNKKVLRMGGKLLEEYDEDAESSELSFVGIRQRLVSEEKNVGIALTSYSLTTGFGINNEVDDFIAYAPDSVGEY